MTLEKVIENFLTEYTATDKSYLLGLSGGGDSIALFYLLLKFKKINKLRFSVAHINHNWRKESVTEKETLKSLVEEAGITFHLLELEPEKVKGNLEESCRKERLIFFKTLVKDFGYEGVFLAHHLNDQSETVLKRIFEGAFLPKLQGLSFVKRMGDLSIFRPFLKVKKKEIEKWLEENKIEAFDDATNRDQKFMRARFRQTVFPFLNDIFGKKIEEPLYRLGCQSFELDQYLKKMFCSYEDKIIRGPFGSSFTFKENLLPFEIKYLIRLFAESEGILITYSIIETIFYFIQSNASNKQIKVSNKTLFIDRKILFCIKVNEKSPFTKYLDIDTEKLGSFELTDWKLTLSKLSSQEMNEKRGWRQVFKGELSLVLNPGKYRLLFFDKGFNLNKKWSNAKVPAFLRGQVPLVIYNQSLYADFLIEKKSFLDVSKKDFFRLDLKAELAVADEKRIC